MKIFGGINLASGKEYGCDELLQLKGQKFGLHGTDWTFAGDLDLDDGDIFVDVGDGSFKTFAGSNALNEFVAFLEAVC